MSEQKTGGIGKQVTISVLAAACTFSLGFGLSQQTAVAQVKELAIEIKHLREADDRIDKRITELSVQTDKRIFEVVGLAKSILDQNTSVMIELKQLNERLASHLAKP